jgi:hypothetical protein
VASGGMSHAEKYAFDLQGFLVLRGVFGADMVQRANAAVDAHLHRMHERKDELRTSGLYGRESQELAGDGVTGRIDLGGMLGWAAPHREPFRELLCHPTVARVLTTLLGVGFRLDHSPLLIAQDKGAEGHTLHGGAVTEAGEPAWPLAYEFRHGQMRNQLLTVCMQLADAPQGAGGFCAVAGSHKVWAIDIYLARQGGRGGGGGETILKMGCLFSVFKRWCLGVGRNNMGRAATPCAVELPSATRSGGSCGPRAGVSRCTTCSLPR